MKEKPYIEKLITTTELLYNPNFGDDKTCVCGHSYYRHFDSYEDMEACGCKFCGCYTFVELREDIDELIKQWKEAYMKVNGHSSPDMSYKNGWFEIYGDPTKFRKAQILKFIETLESKFQ